jgi:hypothetical protein
MRYGLRGLAIAVICMFCSVPTFAQPRAAAAPVDGRLILTVVDQTRAVLPGATVMVVGQEEATRGAVITPSQTSAQGIATIAGIRPGRYNIEVEFSGFEKGVVRDVRIRAGENRQTITLQIEKQQDSITVGQDPQSAAADRRGTQFGSALTREQIDALSDDQDEMKKQLMEMAGNAAVLRVDSFEGAQLPPKSQIKSIHITRDAFAAENHGSNGIFVDIITQPGVGKMRVGTNFRFRDGATSGRSPFTPTKGPENIKNFGFNVGGSLIPRRAGFQLGVNGQRSFDTANLNVALPGVTRSEALPIRSARNNTFVNGMFDFAITRDQTLRIGYNHFNFSNGNLGIGAYDLPERAFSSEDSSHTIRVQEAGPIGRRFFTNTRVFVGVSDTESRSATEVPTIRVNDAFTAGGAQNAGGRHSRTFNVASDLDYVRSIHSVRTGVWFDGGFHRSDDRQNYLGTYTFESLDQYLAGVPRSYTRRIGDPNVKYFTVQSGIYVQDDIRVSRNLTLSPGLRYEAQTHLDDVSNFGPRFGVTWAPFKNGRTTLRTSAGIFYDWMGFGTYEQILRVDGFRQQELNIINPSFPDPGTSGIVPPINRYLLGDQLTMTRSKRVSAGIDQTVSPRMRVNATYAYILGDGAWRGLNLNPPVGGVRPDPVFGNIVEVVSDGANRRHTLTTSLSINLARTQQGGPVLMNGRDAGPPPPPIPGFGQPNARLWDWSRVNINSFYTFGRFTSNSEGAFALPATGDLSLEWGPTGEDIRHRINVGIGTQQLRNLSANLGVEARSGSPYTIRTGRDDNGDLVFNDRPAGVGRGTERTDGFLSLNLSAFYTIPFGKGQGSAPPGVGIFIAGPGAAPQVATLPPPPARYRIQLILQIQNLTNHTNYGGYSGTLTSPFFGLPTLAINPRKVDFGLGFNF